MKKILVCALIGAALLGCCLVSTKSGPSAPELRGTWTGEARFLDRDLAKEYGSFAVDIEVHADDSVSGTLGSAALTDAVALGRAEDFVIKGGLKGHVFEGGTMLDEENDCVVFILSPPAGVATAGNIHLKSNPIFDANMRVCGVELTRKD